MNSSFIYRFYLAESPKDFRCILASKLTARPGAKQVEPILYGWKKVSDQFSNSSMPAQDKSLRVSKLG